MLWHDGVTLTVDLDTRIERERRFWFNADVQELTLRRELDYHAVSDRYLVRDVRSGTQKSFATLEEALADLGAVDGWPVLIEPQLAPGNYRISVRAGVRPRPPARVAACAHVLDRRLAPRDVSGTHGRSRLTGPAPGKPRWRRGARALIGQGLAWARSCSWRKSVQNSGEFSACSRDPAPQCDRRRCSTALLARKADAARGATIGRMCRARG